MKKLFKKLLRKFGYKITRYESLPYNKRILEVNDIFQELIAIVEKNSVEGIFVECGFGYGRSFAVLSHYANKLKRKIFGFDSFIGFPNVTQDDQSLNLPKNGDWSVRTLEEANKYINGLGIFNSVRDYELIKIEFSAKTDNPIPKEKIALLHIDLDLYEGYKYALEIFYDQIPIGGIILFDEYNEDKWPGATKAVNEFLAIKNLTTSHLKNIKGKHYLVKSL